MQRTGYKSPNNVPEMRQLCDICRVIIRSSVALDSAEGELTTEFWPQRSKKDCLREAALNSCHVCSLMHMQTFDFIQGPLTLRISRKEDEQSILM